MVENVLTKKSEELSIIHIVTVTNDTYAEPLAVMLNSLLENKVSKNPIQIYVIFSALSSDNKALLAKTVGRFNLQINFMPIEPTLYEPFKTVRYLTKETYYRISIPELLNEEVEKVIYLDGDIIVKADISGLWNTNVNDYYLAAVEDFWIKSKDSRGSHLLPKNSKYFNAGVLLINVKKWRENDIKNKVIEFIKKNSSRVKFCSQDPLNAVLCNKWRLLDIKWNFMPHYLTYPKLKKVKPAIIHYAGVKKPWKDNCRLKEEYLKYRKNVFI